MIPSRNIAKVFLVILFLALSILIFNNQVFSNEKSEEKISQWIKQLNDEDWRIRDRTVAYLNKLEENQKTEKVKAALISLLKKEIIIEKDGKEIVRQGIPCPPPCEGEGHMEYVMNLVEVVAQLRDPRTIPFLVQLTSFPEVRIAIVEMGEPVIEPLIDQLINGLNKLDAARTLGLMVKKKEKGYITSATTKGKIKQALLKALQANKHPMDKSIEWYEVRAMQRARVRLAIVEALAEFSDKDLIPVLQGIAKNDPYSYTKDFGPVGTNPVREEAQKILEKLKKEGKIKE